MEQPTTIDSYLRAFSNELGERILQPLPPLHSPDDPCSPLLAKLLRRPYPGQALAIMGTVKRLAEARSAGVVAECGTGKTLISLASAYVAAGGRAFTALVLAPSHLTSKWARESLLTVPRARVFLIDGLRDSTCKSRNGIQEVKLRGGQVVREGLKMALTDLRLRRGYRTARARWNSLCPAPAIFVSSKEVAKLSYFWRHAYIIGRSGRFRGSVVNPDTGRPIYAGEDDEQLLTSDFKKVRLSEWIGPDNETDENSNHTRRKLFSPLWQADRSNVRRYAVIEFIGRYLPDFFDFGAAVPPPRGPSYRRDPYVLANNVEPRFLPVNPETRYSEAAGYGWITEGFRKALGIPLTPYLEVRSVAKDPKHLPHDALFRDYVQGEGGDRFRVKAPAGEYTVLFLHPDHSTVLLRMGTAGDSLTIPFPRRPWSVSGLVIKRSGPPAQVNAAVRETAPHSYAPGGVTITAESSSPRAPEQGSRGLAERFNWQSARQTANRVRIRRPEILHTPPQAISAGEALTLALHISPLSHVSGVRLYYRPVNQLAQFKTMEADLPHLTFTIPGDDISDKRDLMYYFEILNKEYSGWFEPDPLVRTPYYAVITASA